MITVCHIITKLELGGAQQNTLYTVQHLDRTKFRPLLISGTEGLLVEQSRQCVDIQKYYIPELVREIRPREDIHAMLAIRRILREEMRQAPDIPLIVHTHSSKAGILGRWAAKFEGIPWIVHSIHGFSFHDKQPRGQRWLYIMLEWMTARITHRFISVSEANRQTGIRLRLFPPSRVSLIRSGIDIARFRNSAPHSPSERQAHRTAMCRQLRLPSEKTLVGMVACFKPQKAPLDFLQAIKHVVKRSPNVHAVMVGDGLLRPQIEEFIAQHGLHDHVTLLGWRTDVQDILPLFDLLVLTSYWEGLPRVCPQAMAAGLPIVATAVDGIPEAVANGISGYLVPPGDIQGIAEKIDYLARHPKAARQMGRAGQQRVDEFDIHRMVQQQEELYHSLIASRNM